MFTVTITTITGAIDTGNITASSRVKIYSNMTITTPIIYSTSTMAAGIVLLEYITVRVKMMSTTFIEF